MNEFMPGERLFVRNFGMMELLAVEDANGVRSYRLRGDLHTIVVPVALEGHVRRPMDGETARQVIASMSDEPPADTRPWEDRFRDRMNRIKNGAPWTLAGALREMLHEARRKELSFGERKLLDTAAEMLAGEIAHALGIAPTEARDRLTSR